MWNWIVSWWVPDRHVDWGSLVGDGPQEMAIRDPTKKGSCPIPNCWASSSSMMLASAPESIKVTRSWVTSGRRNLV